MMNIGGKSTVPEPVILPVSAVITDDSGERRNYDRVLDEVPWPSKRTSPPIVISSGATILTARWQGIMNAQQ